MNDDALTELFDRERRRLFAIAYRMLGSVGDAEDVVHETFLRFQQSSAAGAVREPRRLLSTIATRLAIDQLRSSRRMREQYVGPWLPDLWFPANPTRRTRRSWPIRCPWPSSSSWRVSHRSSEQCSCCGRRSTTTTRRSRTSWRGRRITAVRSRCVRAATSTRVARGSTCRLPLATRWHAACQDGDTEALLALLAADCVTYGDGGGRTPAARAPIHGRERAARALIGLARMGRRVGVRYAFVTVNGQPGARVVAPDGRLVNVVALDIADGHVQTVRSILNPDKLRHLAPLADLRALLASLAGR